MACCDPQIHARITFACPAMLTCLLHTAHSEQEAAERNAKELLATEAQCKSHTEGGQKKGKKKKKVDIACSAAVMQLKPSQDYMHLCLHMFLPCFIREHRLSEDLIGAAETCRWWTDCFVRMYSTHVGLQHTARNHRMLWQY